MVEVHDDPNFALSDKDETIDFHTFDLLLENVKIIANAMKKQTI